MTADGDGGSSGGGTDEGGGSGGSGSGSGKDHGNNKRSGKAGALAGTGDVNAPFTAAAAALAAAGAGLIAYSARRTALETGTADEVNSDKLAAPSYFCERRRLGSSNIKWAGPDNSEPALSRLTWELQSAT